MKIFFLSLLTLLASNFLYSTPPAEVIDISRHPTIGDPQAPVNVVAFLEPKCPDSKKYHDESFPKLQTEFIQTNKIRYTVIITSFLPQSMPAALALLCVYNQDPNKPRADLFLTYLGYIYKNQPPERQNWATIETLQKFAAKASPEINQDLLKRCIESKHGQDQIEKNTAYGNHLMGNLSTPTIFVDNIKVENDGDLVNYEKLSQAIQTALQNKTTKRK